MIGNVFAVTNENELTEIIFDGDESSLQALVETTQIKQNNQRQIDLYYLQKAKFNLINGDINQAEFYLKRISEIESTVSSIKNRYLATIYFIQGRFQDSIKTIQSKKINNNYIIHTCLLKLVNYMAVNDLTSLNNEKNNCMFQTASFSKNDQFWLDTMIKLKNNDKENVNRNMLTDINSIFNNDDYAKLWLKTGLYLNKEKDLLSLISELSESSYQSKKLREIVAFLYLRSGDENKALSFVDDIETANAENIKGNINLKNKEYELAFGHFQLALKKKQDSNNALERAIPLSWLLSQWEDGLSMLNNLSNPVIDKRNTHALKIAFLIRQKKFLEAKNELTLLKISFQNQPPFEVAIMDSYINLVIDAHQKVYDKRKIEESTEKSCQSFDGISCWIALQYIQWNNLGKTITRKEKTYSDTIQTIETLKLKQSNEPIIEEKSIDQSDVEELDGRTISINSY
jgi:hypothetical protein